MECKTATRATGVDGILQAWAMSVRPLESFVLWAGVRSGVRTLERMGLRFVFPASGIPLQARSDD